MDNFELIPLGEVVEIVGGGTPSKRSPNFYGGKIPWATVRDMNIDELTKTEHSITEAGLAASSAKVIPAGNIVIATRVGLGKVCRLMQDTAINQDLRGLIPKDNRPLDQKYLFYWYKSISEKVIAAGTGATVQGVKLPFVKSLNIPLPPLGEQRRIVAVLDEALEGLDRARANAEANLYNANELFENVVDQAFAENKWRATELEQIVHDECSLSYGIVQPGDEVLGGLPIVRPTDMTKRVIDLDGLKRIDPDRAASYKRTTLVGGELLVCVRGTTGTVSIANNKLLGANVTRGIVPIRFDSNKFNTWFAYYQFRSKYIREQIEQKTYGAALMQINIRDVRKISILCPSLEEQSTVAKKLEFVSRKYDELCKGFRTKLSAIADLRQSILQRAFAGELTR